jgi:hypothetical protein
MPVFTLADVERDIWCDLFGIGPGDVRLPVTESWSVRKRTLRGGLRDGVDLIEVNNGALAFSVLPTRGMGLWRGDYRGLRLGWDAPVTGPVHPKFVNTSDRGGIGWLHGFDEWLCRCGLAWNGPPGDDGGTMLTLHGRIANQPAHKVEVEVGTEPPYPLTVRGEVEEGGLFYPRLLLRTEYTTTPGSNRATIQDQVTNRGGSPAEMQLLYHCNLGPPLATAGGRFHTPVDEMWPMTAHAAGGIGEYPVVAGPRAGFAEQVYCFRPAHDAAGQTLAVLHDASARRAIALRWSVAQLPCFTLWKNTADVNDGYVVGLEPATNFPRFRAAERPAGRVATLLPGATWQASWSMEVADDAAAVVALVDEVNALQAAISPAVHRTPLTGP